jgi:aminoglycoside phosphotransferase family enzyme
MEEDLQREIARNEAANRMAMEREAQALAARRRSDFYRKGHGELSPGFLQKVRLL